ncbi:hypothetical protein KA405_00735 [Patescibacteria group bacterium]|nr:hypothetical protein [Patescibacteria group bacterium]
MVGRIFIIIITEVGTKLMVTFIEKKYQENPDFISDLKKRLQFKIDEFEDNCNQSISLKKKKISDWITEIREIIENVINEHFGPELREKIYQDITKQLDMLIPIFEKKTKNVKKDLDSLLSVLKEVKKKNKK